MMTSRAIPLPAANLATARKPYDLPLHRGSGGHLVMWIVGVMTYLCVLAMVMIFALNAVQSYWIHGMTDRMTVEIPYEIAQKTEAATINRLVSALNTMTGVQARILTQDDIATLVGPWLGTGSALGELPLPTLIDIHQSNGRDIIATKLIADKVTSILPEAVLDTHQEWLADLLKLARACRMVLIGIALILALTTALTVAATARTRLALHRAEVDLLHLIGATDSYIAKQFQRQAFRLATEGAAIGLVLAFLTVLAIGFAKSRLGDMLLPGLSLNWVEIAVLILTPLLAGLIAMVASRFTIMRALKDLP